MADIERKMLAIDAELHADLEARLLGEGSGQSNSWGANLYPFKSNDDFIEYTALINVSPVRDNFSIGIESGFIREKIKDIVFGLITE